MKGTRFSYAAVHAGCALLVCLPFLASAYADSKTLGEVEFAPAGKIDKVAGVWVDGTYVGYTSGVKLLLVPGEHQIIVRHAGYRDLAANVVIEPGTSMTLPVRLEQDPKSMNAETTSEMRIIVKPSRAAVFLNGGYVGHVGEFDGLAQGMLLPPGTYTVRIALAGYRPFETKIHLEPMQKLELKTTLVPEASGPAAP